VSRNLPFVKAELEKRWKEGHPKFLPFSVGQSVLMKIHKPGNLNVHKFTPNYKGPFEITKVNSNGVTYELLDPSSSSAIRAHHTDLHAYKMPPNYISQNPYFQSMNSIKIDFPNVDLDSNQNNLPDNIYNLGALLSSDYDESSSSGSEPEDVVGPGDVLDDIPDDVIYDIPDLMLFSNDGDTSTNSPFLGFESQTICDVPTMNNPNQTISNYCCAGCRFEARKESIGGGEIGNVPTSNFPNQPQETKFNISKDHVSVASLEQPVAST
jgi:hypothetical protein